MIAIDAVSPDPWPRGSLDTLELAVDRGALIYSPGFAATLMRATANGPAMDHFETRDPYPEIAGFSARRTGSSPAKIREVD